MSRYVGDNRHNISYVVKILTSKEIRLYASCKGFRITYYANTLDDLEPMLSRNEPYFPSRFDQQSRPVTWFAPCSLGSRVKTAPVPKSNAFLSG